MLPGVGVPFRRHLPGWGVSRLARAGLVIIFCLPFEAMWSYFAWMNQTLAMVTLWMITAYLLGGALTLAILITMIFKMRRDAKSIS